MSDLSAYETMLRLGHKDSGEWRTIAVGLTAVEAHVFLGTIWPENDGASACGDILLMDSIAVESRSDHELVFCETCLAVGLKLYTNPPVQIDSFGAFVDRVSKIKMI